MSKALITGATSGIGYEMTKILVNQYDTVVAVGRNKEVLESLKNEYQNIITYELDITDRDGCIKLFEEHKDVDLLINNAGFGDAGLFDETSLDKDLKMIDTNIVGLHILTKLYLKEMKERNSGHILNVASSAGFLPGPLMATYYATKNYVVRLSEAIYRELKKEKSIVKISILCPGPVDTNFNKQANVKFALKGKKSNDVALYALKHLNRFYIVPGFTIKCVRFFARLVPSLWMSKMVYKQQKKKNN